MENYKAKGKDDWERPLRYDFNQEMNDFAQLLMLDDFIIIFTN
jgi:hypothetical protein